MLYRRRFIEQNRTEYQTQSNTKKLIVSKNFQYKYCWYVFTAVAGGALLFLIPSFFFISQNYELFKTLAYDVQPHLVSHLEREVIWLKIFLFLSFIFISLVTLVLSMRMTKNLLSPLLRMEKHMHKLMLGQWNTPDFSIRDIDDFRELAMTYDYFYRALKANTEVELSLLTKLNIDPQNREAYAAWNQLLNTKRARLGIKDEFIVNESIRNINEYSRRPRAS